jgi:hypothetical protein
MAEKFAKIRRHSKIEHLPEETRDELDRLLIEGMIYEDIVAHFKTKGVDLSRSGVGRYGKDFANQVREMRVFEDKSRALVSEAGGNNLVLEEAASKLFSKKIVELLLADGVSIMTVPRILSDFAKLQASSIMREKQKAEFKQKVGKALDKVEKQMKSMSKEEMVKAMKEAYGL